MGSIWAQYRTIVLVAKLLQDSTRSPVSSFGSLKRGLAERGTAPQPRQLRQMDIFLPPAFYTTGPFQDFGRLRRVNWASKEYGSGPRQEVPVEEHCMWVF